MHEGKAAVALILYGLAKLSKFNAFAGVLLGLGYGMIANLADREFLGLGSTQITLLGVACFVVFFGTSIGLTMASNWLVGDVENAKGE